MKILWKNSCDDIYGKREINDEDNITDELINFLETGDNGRKVMLCVDDTITIEN